MIGRNRMAAPAAATHPYSTSITQAGSAPHGRPSVRKCHWTYTGMMLTVQIIISTVDADVRNGSSQRRYQGNTAGAHRRVAAMGQANMGHGNAYGDNSGAPLPLSQVAVANPTSTASATSKCGGATRSSIANTGPLKRKFCTYVPSEPIGMRP